MPDPARVLRVLSEFSHTLVRQYDLDEALFGVCQHAADVLDADGAGITVGNEHGELSFAAALNATSTELERLQEQTQSGPCSDAFRTGDLVHADDLQGEDRWPDFTPAALRLGMTAVLGVPMALDGTSLGALNVYSAEGRAWSDDDLSTAQVFADMATSYLLHASERDRFERTRGQLEHALENRIVIEQAKGIMAARHGITVDAAFERLRRHARSHGATLRSVADAIVRLGLTLD
jgi:GAF domain-containing protein